MEIDHGTHMRWKATGQSFTVRWIHGIFAGIEYDAVPGIEQVMLGRLAAEAEEVTPDPEVG